MSKLLEPFVPQVCVSARGWGRILGVGPCAPCLDCGTRESVRLFWSKLLVQILCVLEVNCKNSILLTFNNNTLG